MKTHNDVRRNTGKSDEQKCIQKAAVGMWGRDQTNPAYNEEKDRTTDASVFFVHHLKNTPGSKKHLDGGDMDHLLNGLQFHPKK